MATTSESFCLKWDSYQTSVTTAFDILREQQELTDATLCCDGDRLNVHKVILSACSPYFRDVVNCHRDQHLVFFLSGTRSADLHALVHFMYRGRVNVTQGQLAGFLRTAEALQIRGLTGDGYSTGDEGRIQKPDVSVAAPPSDRSSTPQTPRYHGTATVPVKRRRPDYDSVVAAVQPASPTSRQIPALPVPHHISTPPISRHTAASPIFTNMPVLDGTGNAGSPVVKREKLEPDDDDRDCVDADDEVSVVQSRFPETPPQFGAARHTESSQMAPRGSHSFPCTPSDSPPGGAVYTCEVCQNQYTNRISLVHHVKSHQGKTTCPVCCRVFSMVANLRCHMRTVHSMSQQQVCQLVPTRVRYGHSGSQTSEFSAQSCSLPPAHDLQTRLNGEGYCAPLSDAGGGSNP